MKYKYIKEERDYKYGPGNAFANWEEANAHVRRVRNEVLTKLSLEGFYKAIQSIKQEEGENFIKLKIVIKYPVEMI